MNEKSKKGFQPVYLVAIAYVLVVYLFPLGLSLSGGDGTGYTPGKIFQ